MTALLSAEGVSKRFGGVAALRDVSLEVDAHEAVGLVGPNGAGKTTLFNCLLGVLRPDRGTITFDGRSLVGLPIYRRARLGIGRTFQRMELFAGLTPREHLLVAERARRGDGRLWKDLLNRSAPSNDEIAAVEVVLALLGLDDVADAPVEALSLGRGRLVELGRALVGSPRLLLLDEPSSGLDAGETAALVEVLERVRAERGTAVLLVEHDLDMVQRAVSRLYVIDAGAILAAGPTAEVMHDAAVRRAYLGAAS
jgi:branched-chain amino acid transport system ATP-binding protein